MSYLLGALDRAMLALRMALSASPEIWIIVALFTVIAMLLTRITWAFFSVWWNRRRASKQRRLGILINDDDDDDTAHIWLTSATRNALGLFDYQTISIQGLNDKRRLNGGRAKLVEVRRRNTTQTGLQAEQIEMSYRLFKMLFPSDSAIRDGTPTRWLQFTPINLKRGMQQFWFNTNEQLQYQNRFSVYLSVGLTILSVILSFVQK